jgi:hypothetical protein
MKRTTKRELQPVAGGHQSIIKASDPVSSRNRHQSGANHAASARTQKEPRPDFAARLKEFYGERVSDTTGTELIRDSRGER